jgi:hypothetical protein
MGRGTSVAGGGVTGASAFYPSIIESSFDGSPPHELRSQGGTKAHLAAMFCFARITGISPSPTAANAAQ